MSDELGKELDDFLGSAPAGVGDPPEPPVEPPAEPPAEPPVEPPAPPMEPESLVEPAQPPVVEPPPPVEPPVEPPAPSADDETISLLRAQIEDLQGKLLGRDKPAEPAAPVAPTPPPEPPKPLNFLEGKSLEDILDDPAKFNELLVSVYERGKSDSRDAATEKVLTSIPELIVKYTSRQNAMNAMVSDFYKKNQDLVNVKKTVAAVANDVAAEHADWNVQQVFDEAAIRTRKVLGFKSGVTPPPSNVPPPDSNANKPNPPFVNQKGRTTPKGPQLTGIQKEVADLIS